MSDTFEEATKELLELQERHDKLSKDLPNLEAKHTHASEELTAMNRQLLDKEDALTKLDEDIKRRTAAYNEWQRKELETLKVRTDEFKKTEFQLALDKKDHEAAVLLFDEEMKKGRLDLEKRIASEEQAVREDRAELKAKAATHETWVNQLTQTENDLRQRESGMTARETDMEARAKKLEEDELRLKETLEAAEKAQKEAENEHKQARTLVDGLKERIATTDMRESNNEQQGQLLEQRKLDLDRKEAALNDRRDVLLSHGPMA